MHDPRVDELARILVRHSVEVESGQTVLISGPDAGKPLMLAIYREALRAGAHPMLRVHFEEAQKVFLDEASDEQLGHLSPILLSLAEGIDRYIAVSAPTNLRALSRVDPVRQITHARAMRPFFDKVLVKRWVVCTFPTVALAQEADMALDEYEDFVFAATNVDWAAVREEQRRLKGILEAGSKLRIVGPGTDLTLSTAGRTWIPSAGEANMPDGEVFTGPLEESAHGRITFSFPTIYGGREIEGVELEFEAGRVVRASARKGQAYLDQALGADDGARRLGEVGVGTNYAISRFTKNIGLDEKIGGTIHLALGRSYAETGGVNESVIHWDLICDLRQGGALFLDGTRIQQDGRFVV